MQKQTTGRYGEFGGAYIPEILVTPMAELTDNWNRLKHDAAFKQNFDHIVKTYAGRPTALTEATRFSDAIFGPQIFLKREDLLHTGAHKLNNALGQCLLAKESGKKRIIAETGAGQHGVATAAACAYFGLPCVVYMGAEDMRRQQPNVVRMQMMGAEVVSVDSGSETLKDAVNEAMRDWSSSFDNTHYCLGSALGPHPFPEMVAWFQSVIGVEAKSQFTHLFTENPSAVIACVGGGSNAIGIFSAFIDDKEVALIGVEGGGHGDKLGEHAARFKTKTPGVLHGSYTYLLQDEQGQVAQTASISAGLDYPAVGPQHVDLYTQGRAQYISAYDTEAVNALQLLAETEGIICALESAHALAGLIKLKDNFSRDQKVIVNLSGRGDKDLPQLMEQEVVK
jgi:tryptophan synthase beta subunit